jgi:hypothetical protein
MDLSLPEFTYFVQNVGLAALSFGVTQDDVNTVANVLYQYFGYRCSPPLDIVGGGPQLQSICIGDGCPNDPNAVCSKYPWYGYSWDPQVVPGCMYSKR